MARLEGFEPPTPWFVARYSIQLSYRRCFKPDSESRQTQSGTVKFTGMRRPQQASNCQLVYRKMPKCKSEIWIRVLNTTGGCISWRQCSSEREAETLAELKALFTGADFCFDTSGEPPQIPAGGYRPPDPQKRKIRFVRNIT